MFTIKKIGSLAVVNNTTATLTIPDRYRLHGIEIFLENDTGTSPIYAYIRRNLVAEYRIIANGETLQAFDGAYEVDSKRYYEYSASINTGPAGNSSMRFSDPALFGRGFGLEAYAHSALATAGLEELRLEIDWITPTSSSCDVATVYLIGDQEDKTPYKGTPHRRVEQRQVPAHAAGTQLLSIDVSRRRYIKNLAWREDDFTHFAVWGIRNTGERQEIISRIDEQHYENIAQSSGPTSIFSQK